MVGKLFSKIFRSKSNKNIETSDSKKDDSAVLVDKKKNGDSPVYSLTLEKIPSGRVEHISLPHATIIQLKTQGDSPVYNLPTDKEFFIGKNDENDLCLSEKGISDTHAKIRPEKDGYILYDLGSEAGVTVNWEKKLKHKLEHRDRIKIGSYILIFEFEKQEDNIFEGIERRKTIRIKPVMMLKFIVHSENKPEEYSATVEDISLDGVRIETEKELQKGSVVEAGLSSKEFPLMEFVAQVIWTGAKQKEDKLIYEAGLQFTEVEEKSIERLKKYLVNVR